MTKITVVTNQAKQVLDVTDLVEKNLSASGMTNGTCLLFLTHTTAALTTADLDPGTDQDLLEAVERMIPRLNYRHPHNPKHVWSHIAASLVGPSLSLIAENGKMVLGTWQRVVLVELDGPREREILIHCRPERSHQPAGESKDLSG